MTWTKKDLENHLNKTKKQQPVITSVEELKQFQHDEMSEDEIYDAVGLHLRTHYKKLIESGLVQWTDDDYYIPQKKGQYTVQNRKALLRLRGNHTGRPDLQINVVKFHKYDENIYIRSGETEFSDDNGVVLEFFGFFLEIKTIKATPFLKDGSLSKGNHVQEQAQVLKNLREQGYYAEFGVGLNDCIAKIDAYLRDHKQESKTVMEILSK